MKISVVVEMRMPKGLGVTTALQSASQISISGFQLDEDYPPVPIGSSPSHKADLADTGEEVVLVRGEIEESEITTLEAQPTVLRVWRDSQIAPFGSGGSVQVTPQDLGDCPFEPCDCNTANANGTLLDVARYLGVDDLWERGHRGEDIVIGIVDGGITAQNRTISSVDRNHVGDDDCHPNGIGNLSWPRPLVPNVSGGWPPNSWGTTGVDWCWHGNMVATDALGMAPNAQIFDIRISDSVLSDALAGYEWAINHYRDHGTPHILNNSWGLHREGMAQEYATDHDHFFTRKVVEALAEGILVVFAAGNCGERCPITECCEDLDCDKGGDYGPGRSIWGANGHPRVMTVGAVNLNEELIGYSSQGPAALAEEKPDFCALSHYAGYFNVDTGTSAAAPIVAGVVALLKQAMPSLTQSRVKNALKASAIDIGPAGWDRHSGAGIVQAEDAYRIITAEPEAAFTGEWLESVMSIILD